MTVFLHGFWGQSKDWNAVLHKLPLGERVWVPDLYEPGPLSPANPLGKWTKNFLNLLQEPAGAEPVQLIGYSMGARLALHAFVQAPEKFSRVLLLSGAPFIPAEARAGREAWEKEWARKFLNEDWAALEQAWQEQPVLNSSAPAERRQSPALREMLGLSLTNWSPRLHSFGPDDVKNLPAHVEWAFGALDQKYANLAKTLQDLPVQGQITLIPNAGHRLTTEADDFIRTWIEKR